MSRISIITRHSALQSSVLFNKETEKINYLEDNLKKQQRISTMAKEFSIEKNHRSNTNLEKGRKRYSLAYVKDDDNNNNNHHHHNDNHNDDDVDSKVTLYTTPLSIT